MAVARDVGELVVCDVCRRKIVCSQEVCLHLCSEFCNIVVIIIGHQILICEWHAIKTHVAEGAVAEVCWLSVGVARTNKHVVGVCDRPVVKRGRPFVVGVQIVINPYNIIGSVNNQGEMHPFACGYCHSGIDRKCVSGSGCRGVETQ